MSQDVSVGVLMGGNSSEREISLKSGRAVYDALSVAGLNVCAIDVVSEDAQQNRKVIENADIDIAFIALHGCYGEDGGIQRLLEEMAIAYTGSDAAASSLAMDKVRTQTLLRQNGIQVPDFCVLKKDNGENGENVPDDFKSQCVVKPSCEGSSVGITIVEDLPQWGSAIQQALSFETDVLVERFVRGKELTVGILGDETLPVIEIRPQEKFFNFAAKYEKGYTQYCVPAPLSDEETRQAQVLGRKAFEVIGCRDLGRVDIILGDDGCFYVLEINTIPGFTQTSLLPMAAAHVGKSFTDVCLLLVDMARQRR